MHRQHDAPTLLIVEDDRDLAALLAELFSAEGYAVDVAHDGQQGLHRGLRGDYDAAIVDRGLPVLEGAELVSVWRARGIETPTLLLTARGAVEDRVEGLDAGAHDYLVKPFDVAELLARVRALLRRPTGAQTLRAGGLTLDRLSLNVTGDALDHPVELSRREADLLAVLMTSPRRVFTRGQLMTAVFGDADTPGVVDTYVHYLRRKLGKRVVDTVHGTGYRFGTQ
ncbi:MAG: response regulator transcription factor [Mycobacterium sp.]|nr:response regulator transcription factor [Mycobacterium sp.]